MSADFIARRLRGTTLAALFAASWLTACGSVAETPVYPVPPPPLDIVEMSEFLERAQLHPGFSGTYAAGASKLGIWFTGDADAALASLSPPAGIEARRADFTQDEHRAAVRSLDRWLSENEPADGSAWGIGYSFNVRSQAIEVSNGLSMGFSYTPRYCRPLPEFAPGTRVPIEDGSYADHCPEDSVEDDVLYDATMGDPVPFLTFPERVEMGHPAIVPPSFHGKLNLEGNCLLATDTDGQRALVSLSESLARYDSRTGQTTVAGRALPMDIPATFSGGDFRQALDPDALSAADRAKLTACGVERAVIIERFAAPEEFGTVPELGMSWYPAARADRKTSDQFCHIEPDFNPSGHPGSAFSVHYRPAYAEFEVLYRDPVYAGDLNARPMDCQPDGKDTICRMTGGLFPLKIVHGNSSDVVRPRAHQPFNVRIARDGTAVCEPAKLLASAYTRADIVMFHASDEAFAKRDFGEQVGRGRVGPEGCLWFDAPGHEPRVAVFPPRAMWEETGTVRDLSALTSEQRYSLDRDHAVRALPFTSSQVKAQCGTGAAVYVDVRGD